VSWLWWIVGGVVGVGVIALAVVLLFFTDYSK
jgi:hypothetical protein